MNIIEIYLVDGTFIDLPYATDTTFEELKEEMRNEEFIEIGTKEQDLFIPVNMVLKVCFHKIELGEEDEIQQ